MRERKYRAWDGEKMLYRGLFDRNWYATPANDDRGCHCVGGIHPDDKYNMKVMDFTGLKDKNGIEIYEGDIVKFISNDSAVLNSNMPEEIEIQSVVYEPWSASFKLSAWSMENHYPLEVIGNIYESPELLKGA